MAVSKHVRLSDVAAHAGVSIKTVSNVVNGFQHVRPSMRQHVQQAIDELGYRPDASGRTLRTGRTGLVGLAVPDLGNPYFADLAQRLVAEARKYDMRLLIEQTGGDRDEEVAILSGRGARMVDGLIFSPLSVHDEDLRNRKDQIPLVLLGEHEGGDIADRVDIDSVGVAFDAVTHLIEGGRRRIAMLGWVGTNTTHVSRNRRDGYLRALEAAGIARDPELIRVVHPWGRLTGKTAAEQLIASGVEFDAIFCGNDAIALGALTALREKNFNVPGDVAVIGIDNIEESEFCVPSLSTMAIDRQAMAERSFKLLHRRLESPDGETATLATPYALIRRGSSNTAEG
ncbi:LacI family DNA-binding transcriptional regulator [Arthrobacter castelli]|uniref:LacI family DNA-binding transcriptional regulator n=1 Tax=Arthrobacter castelli TaxID=271431 RepID=UPI00041732C3|nr:LacI family DNA-binding transcriptional regulator [Arthrobacter castelli]